MIGLFYGSTNGNTAAVAAMIQQEFCDQANIDVELLDIAEFYLEEMQEFNYLIVGVPTWDVGQLQRDWNAIIEEFENINLKGKRAALFGLGDQVGYPDTFGDALFFVADKLVAQGAELVGMWPAVGYSFTRSWAVVDDHFLGLMVDEDNQAALTEKRIHEWVEQLRREFGIAPPG